MKRKTFSLNEKGNTLYTLTECHYKKKKKKNKKTKKTKKQKQNKTKFKKQN